MKLKIDRGVTSGLRTARIRCDAVDDTLKRLTMVQKQKGEVQLLDQVNLALLGLIGALDALIEDNK